MSWLSNGISSIGRKLAGAIPGNGMRTAFWRLPIAGVTVNEDTALTYSAVWRCTKAITDPMTLMPFRVMRKTNGKREAQINHPVDWILHRQANPEMAASVFKETLQAHALNRGNGYAEIERNNAGDPIALWPITNPVTPKRDDQGTLYYEVRNDNGTTVSIMAENMFHLRGLGFDGLVGYSVIELGKESISLGIAMEQFGSAFFGNGAVLGTVITAPQGVTLEENAVKNLKKTFDKKHKGTRNAHKTEVLDQGMEAKMLGVPPEQAQFLEGRKFQLAEIARWYGVPLHKLMSDTGVTFKNVEELDIVFVNDTLMPWTKRWEEEVDIKLLGNKDPSLYAKMNTKGLLHGDIATRQAWYKEMFGIGVYSINEIREREDEDSIGLEGDLRMVPMNMMSVTQAYNAGNTGKLITGVNQQLDQDQQIRAGAPVFIDAFARMARKEVRAITGFARKTGGLKAFGDRASSFYMEHQAQLCEALTPSLHMLAALNSQSADDYLTALRADIGRYCEDAFSRAVVAYEAKAIQDFTDKQAFDAHDTAVAFLEKQLSQRQAA